MLFRSPYFSDTPAAALAEKRFNVALKEAKEKITGGFVFVQKYYPSRDPSQPPRRSTETAEGKLNAILDSVYTAYVDLKVSREPQKYDVIKGGHRYSLPPKEAGPVRIEFAKEMNNHFDITNDAGQKFVIVNLDPGRGMFSFGLRKPGDENVVNETPEQIKEKDRNSAGFGSTGI